MVLGVLETLHVNSHDVGFWLTRKEPSEHHFLGTSNWGVFASSSRVCFLCFPEIFKVLFLFCPTFAEEERAARREEGALWKSRPGLGAYLFSQSGRQALGWEGVCTFTRGPSDALRPARRGGRAAAEHREMIPCSQCLCFTQMPARHAHHGHPYSCRSPGPGLAHHPLSVSRTWVTNSRASAVAAHRSPHLEGSGQGSGSQSLTVHGTPGSW